MRAEPFDRLRTAPVEAPFDKLRAHQIHAHVSVRHNQPMAKKSDRAEVPS